MFSNRRIELPRLKAMYNMPYRRLAAKVRNDRDLNQMLCINYSLIISVLNNMQTPDIIHLYYTVYWLRKKCLHSCLFKSALFKRISKWESLDLDGIGEGSVFHYARGKTGQDKL
jgi:hypothetical protein